MPPPAADTNQITDADALTAEQRRLGQAHVAQFADFVDAIRLDRPVRVGTQEARAVLPWFSAFTSQRQPASQS